VCARTVRRWQRWWKERFPQTDAWRCIRGLLARGVAVDELPHSLLERMSGSPADRLSRLLRLLGPLSRAALPGRAI
jgi:hypothetical protein